MPRFEPKTFSYFLERMAFRVVARSELTDLEEGGNVHTVLAAVARELDDISYQMVNLQRIWDIDTATGEDLDDRGRDFNPDEIERREASFATGAVVFSRTGTSGAVNIPIGTIVQVPSGGPEFETTVLGTIADGFSDSASVNIIASEAGIAGNVDAGAISQLKAVTGVETVTNPAATTGGQDEETDAQLRARMKAYLRSLPRGTPNALRFAVLNVFLEDFGRIVTAEVVELTGASLGRTIVYVDDGSGTISVTANNIGAPETVVASAAGGEVRLFLQNKPLVPGSARVVRRNGTPLVEGTQFTLNLATGQITLSTPLVALDSLTAEYTWFEGLIEEAQKIIDGDPNDRVNYPGYRAAGTIVQVLPPTIIQQIIQAAVIVEADRLGEAADIREEAALAINRYINGLPINGDVILSELVFQVQSIAGVSDVFFSTPSGNVVIGEGELARVLDSNIDLT